MQDRTTIAPPQLFRRFPNDEIARQYIEGARWNGQPACPHCNNKNNIYARKGKRLGHYLCKSCRNEFTVRTGTIFERSPVGLHKWLYAIYLTVTARKGISGLQLSKDLGVTQKTAWFMQCRIREACGRGGI